MATNTKELTRQWIQYLKNNRIAAMKSDPKTGELRYLRPVTTSDLEHFLEIKTNFSQEAVTKALKTVLAKPGPGNPALAAPTPGNDVSTWSYYGMEPGEPRGNAKQLPPAQAQRQQEPQSAQKKNNTGDVTDVEYRDLPTGESPQKKRRSWFREAIRDEAGDALDEKDVEAIFKILSSSGSEDPIPGSSVSGAERKPREVKKSEIQKSPEEIQAKKEDDIRKFKRIIRDVMTDSQRKSLWRMLNDQATLEESQINNADIKAILKTAADQRNNPSGFRKIFKGLRKDKIDVADLHQAWKDEGYPDDLRDIKALLLGHGFDEKEVKKALSSVFGTHKDDESEVDVPGQSATILKMVKYIKANNLTQDIIDFMTREYGFMESVKHKIMIEDIRQIFTNIAQETRSNKDALIRDQDKAFLGRMKK